MGRGRAKIRATPDLRHLVLSAFLAKILFFRSAPAQTPNKKRRVLRVPGGTGLRSLVVRVLVVLLRHEHAAVGAPARGENGLQLGPHRLDERAGDAV